MDIDMDMDIALLARGADEIGWLNNRPGSTPPGLLYGLSIIWKELVVKF